MTLFEVWIKDFKGLEKLKICFRHACGDWFMNQCVEITFRWLDVKNPVL